MPRTSRGTVRHQGVTHVDARQLAVDRKALQPPPRSMGSFSYRRLTVVLPKLDPRHVHDAVVSVTGGLKPGRLPDVAPLPTA